MGFDFPVIPAKAGIQSYRTPAFALFPWVPAFAGMTVSYPPASP